MSAEQLIKTTRIVAAHAGKWLTRRESILRALAISIALAVGWLLYMIAMFMTTYDGLLSLIFQPIMGAIWSVLTVGMVLIAGLILRISVIGQAWRSSYIPATGFILMSLFVLCFGYSLGLRETFVDPETKQPITFLSTGAALGSYFVLLFAIANWPLKPRLKPEQSKASA